jgi:superfamily II DNA/RNA helicase
VAKLVRDHSFAQVIVFSNTKIGAGRLARQLEVDGLNAAAIHGDKSQQERLKTLEDFKQGLITVLVATDVAARGLDIAELPAVINYDLPYSPEDYVHRIGRTGRAGASGMALSLITGSNDDRLLADIEKLTKRKFAVEDMAVEATLPGHRREARAPRDDERPERVERYRDRDDSRPSRARSSSPMPARPAEDPFFSRPYEPSTEALAEQVESGQSKTAQPAVRRSTRPVPALLGGFKRT